MTLRASPSTARTSGRGHSRSSRAPRSGHATTAAAHSAPRHADGNTPVTAHSRFLRRSLMLLKGPEAAARYPSRARGFGDIDLLVPDARRTQTELVEEGFEQEDDPEGIFVGIHHLARLRLPGSPLPIELHSVPKWRDGLRPPRNDELFEAAIPSDIGVDGLLAPSVSHHAVLLAAHAWAHQPLGRARDLIDVGAFRVVADDIELGRLARAWGLIRPWRTMTACLDAMVARSSTWPLRLWARHLRQLRDQTVLGGPSRTRARPVLGVSDRRGRFSIFRIRAFPNAPPRFRRGLGRENPTVGGRSSKAVSVHQRTRAAARHVGNPDAGGTPPAHPIWSETNVVGSKTRRTDRPGDAPPPIGCGR